MKLRFIDYDQVYEYLPEINNANFFEYKKFPEDSLFSPVIFGPFVSYTCGCFKNAYKGPTYYKKICPKCNVEIISSLYREKRFARIKLPFKVFNPVFFIFFYGKNNILNKIEEIIFKKRKYDKNEGEKIDETIRREIKDAIEQFLESNLEPEHKKLVKDNMKYLFIDYIYVIPPAFRPFTELPNKLYLADELNYYYTSIIRMCNNINKLIVPIQENDSLLLQHFRNLQALVNETYEYIINKLKGKTGLIRSNILGKRMDFSGRAVIVPDPTLSIDYCAVSYGLILEIVKPAFAYYLLSKGYYKRSIEALKSIDQSIADNDYKFIDELQTFLDKYLCLLNRQPSLHRMSLLSFKIKVCKEDVIKLHPLICFPYNADFDGDAMAIYIPMSEESLNDVRKHIFIEHNFISPTNLESIIRPSQDIVLGIYSITKNPGNKEIEYKNTKLQQGRYLFNKCLPETYEVVDKVITKKELLEIIDNIVRIYPFSEIKRTIDNIKEVAFYHTTISGFTLSMGDLYSENLIKLREKLTGNFIQDLKFMSNDKDLNREILSLKPSIYILSGSRGSLEQLRQLVFCRGYVADYRNIVRGNLIKNSFVTGLTPKEFFESCYGTRKGLLDTALSTGDSGYLTRQLIYSTCFVELGEEEDCGTKDCIEICVEDKEMAKSLIGRYYYDTTNKLELKSIDFNNYLSLVNKSIYLRSPVYCKSTKICKTCYGWSHKYLHSNQIGIIASQAIGERTTQLVLRTFHVSGAVSSATDEKENQDIISGMTIAKNIFHNPYNLLIAGEARDRKEKKLSKTKIDKIKKEMKKGPERLVSLLYKVFSKFGSINLVHFEVVVSSMMWADEYLWRTLENRENANYEYISILKVPSKVSWLLGASFSNIKKGILNGFLGKGYDKNTSITELFNL